MTRDVVIFDLGGVLLDWNPRHLYRQLFPGDEAAMEHFLETVCNSEWNRRQDAGRLVVEGCGLLKAEHPDKAALIDAYYARHMDVIAGPIEGRGRGPRSRLRERGTPLYFLQQLFSTDLPAGARPLRFPVVVRGRHRLGRAWGHQARPGNLHAVPRPLRDRPKTTQSLSRCRGQCGSGAVVRHPRHPLRQSGKRFQSRIGGALDAMGLSLPGVDPGDPYHSRPIHGWSGRARPRDRVRLQPLVLDDAADAAPFAGLHGVDVLLRVAPDAMGRFVAVAPSNARDARRRG